MNLNIMSSILYFSLKWFRGYNGKDSFLPQDKGLTTLWGGSSFAVTRENFQRVTDHVVRKIVDNLHVFGPSW